MRIGVLATLQHSMFSAGIANTSIAVAELMRELGHTVELIQLAEKQTWWDDCLGLSKHWTVVSINDAKEYDLIFEIDRLVLAKEKRKALTKKSILVLRKPFLLQELESSLFPTSITIRREFEALTEIWIMDAAAAVEEGSIQALELLSRIPVRVVPYVWSPSPAATYIQEENVSSWLDSTVNALRTLEKVGEKMPPWTVHVGETNNTNASSAVLPLVIMREAKQRGTNIGRWKVHNTDMLIKSRFYLENIVKHCSDEASGLSGEFVGRQRCVDWAREPMSCVLSHIRFSAIRPMLLDVAWAGIPLVHNSLLLRDTGLGLERGYYSDNHIGEACDAFRHLEEDLVTLKGIFAPGAVSSIRAKLLATFSPLSPSVKKGWSDVFGKLETIMPPPVKLTDSTTLNIGFCDMWEDFNPAYNFFTLMLTAAGAKMTPPIKVVGAPATATDSLVIFGPFGNTWRELPTEQPKVHFTGENTSPIPEAKLNLGFHHFDMVTEEYLRFPLWLLEIDWFGADSARIINPKPIPLERCTKVYASEISRKKNFCAFIVSNPNNPIRNAAFQWLSEYKKIDSGGRLFNNIGPELFAGGGGGGGELKKHEFLKDYKFCLTYENNSSRGYVTEKYLHAKAAGCIPIYWGDPAFERDFSIAGCIDARSFTSPEELIEAVRRVDSDDTEWLKRYTVPALDPYKVVWAQRTMAECAKRIFSLGGFDVKSAPEKLGDERVTEPATAKEIVATVLETIETPLMVTFVTRKYLSSLQHWLVSIGSQVGAMPQLKAKIFLSSDVPEDTKQTLVEKFSFVSFETLPDSLAPTGAFPDFWDPQHFGWKLWILKELSGRSEHLGQMIFYTDAGVFLCRWPKDWMLKAQASGLCFLEDPREENKRWCSPEFCSIVKPTEAELASQQIQAATIIFRAGSPLATSVFREAMELAKVREVLVGPKWAGHTLNGKPFGHRHDQSILSIVSLRHSVPRHPLDDVQHTASLRKTFLSGRALYIHRGNFQVHKAFSEKIDEAFVINLDRRADRMERLSKNCPELNGRVERWSAVDGRKLTLTPAIKRLFKPNDFFWKKAVTGCALSHLGLWWKLANEHPSIQNYFIMEDDVKLQPGWENVWKGAVDDIPEDYDIIYLGGILPPNRAAFNGEMKERVNDSFCRIKENTKWGQTTPTRYFHFCAYAYILTKTGAQKVLQLIQSHDGYWTSADHILCNPVNVLKSYILEPIVAGCYQDEDERYATSAFNDFSRIDGFDSDLWNNDDRFTADSGFSDVQMESEIDFVTALKDATAVPVVAVVPTAPAPVITAVPFQRKPFTELPKRFVCLDEHNLDISQLHEGSWLLYLFGNPSTFTIDKVRIEDPPPTDAPIVITQRPHTSKVAAMLEKWDSYGAKFSILHLSDEYMIDSKGVNPQLNDNVDMYDLSGCEKVLRFYVRSGLPDKVTTIPLGYHWTLREGSQNVLVKTPRLPFRSLTWSFFGTEWNERREQLQPLFDISGKYESQFFKNWNSPSLLNKEDYITTLLDTVFVPCPDGMNPETFRFYEALECGCIPLIVRTSNNAAWVDWISEHIQILPVSSWVEAAKLVEHLMHQKHLLESYRTKILMSWMSWRERLQKEMKEWIQV